MFFLYCILFGLGFFVGFLGGLYVGNLNKKTINKISKKEEPQTNSGETNLYAQFYQEHEQGESRPAEKRGMFCKYCGEGVDQDAMFCKFCGKKQ